MSGPNWTLKNGHSFIKDHRIVCFLFVKSGLIEEKRFSLRFFQNLFLRIGLNWRALVDLQSPNIEKQRGFFFAENFFVQNFDLLKKKKNEFLWFCDFLIIFYIFFILGVFMDFFFFFFFFNFFDFSDFFFNFFGFCKFFWTILDFLDWKKSFQSYSKYPQIEPYPLATLKCFQASMSWTCAVFFWLNDNLT